MRNYELMLVISPQLAEEEVRSTVDRVQQLIRDRGGEITEVDTWGRRRLAYPIQRFREGNYVLARFRVDPARVRELDRSLTLAEEVLRHLVVRLDEE